MKKKLIIGCDYADGKDISVTIEIKLKQGKIVSVRKIK